MLKLLNTPLLLIRGKLDPIQMISSLVTISSVVNNSVVSENSNQKKPFVKRQFTQYGKNLKNDYWNNQYEKTKGQNSSESDGSEKPQASNFQKSPTKVPWKNRSNLYDRMDQMQNQLGVLAEQIEKLSNLLIVKPKNPFFLGEATPVQSPAP